MTKLSLLTVLVLCTTLANVWVMAAPCPDGWQLEAGSCYIIPETTSSWIDAQNFCELSDAKLAEVESAVENEFLLNMASEARSGTLWIGGYAIFQGDTWLWASTGQAITYTDWGSGQPNNLGSAEYCLAMHVSLRHHWADVNCIREYKFVCEKAVSGGGSTETGDDNKEDGEKKPFLVLW